jgi:hypothetical protein
MATIIAKAVYSTSKMVYDFVKKINIKENPIKKRIATNGNKKKYFRNPTNFVCLLLPGLKTSLLAM